MGARLRQSMESVINIGALFNASMTNSGLIGHQSGKKTQDRRGDLDSRITSRESPRLLDLLTRPVGIEGFHRIERLELGRLVVGFGDFVLALVAMKQQQAIAVLDPGNR